MRAVILAAGMARRLSISDPLPKILLQFGDETLLARHLRILDHFGVDRIEICVGFRAEKIAGEIARLSAAERVVTHLNTDFDQGSIISLWTMRHVFASGDPVVYMDGDVLYDHRMIRRLIEAEAPNCFLMDRNIDPGEDPVKLCMLDGNIVDFHKQPKNPYDWAGEWVGFVRFTSESAGKVARVVDTYIGKGKRGAIYEEVFRDVLLSAPEGEFGVEDITGLPWVEIDFPEDLEKAEREIFPRLEALPE